jgi:very-short-patch-repair endonuclease
VRSPRPLPDPFTGGPFTYADARASGITRARLRGHALRSPFTGVRVAMTVMSDVVAQCTALLLVLPPGAVFCHVTALRLLGIDLPIGLGGDERLHVQIPESCTWVRRPGVGTHSRSSADVPVRRVAGLPVMAPELVWIQLATVLEPRELVVLGDALVRRKDPHVRLSTLRRTVADLPKGTRGIARLRSALEQVRACTDSCMESRARWVLVDAGLPCPAVNVAARDSTGRFLALPDLSYPELRIAIEYDGDIHRIDTATWRRDIRRRQALEAAGWRVITCTASDVLRNPERLVAWVRAAIRARSRA